METPKEFYNCCNGDNLVGHKKTCLVPFFQKPGFNVFFESDETQDVMVITVPIGEIAAKCDNNFALTAFTEGFMDGRKRQACQLLMIKFNEKIQNQSKLITPNLKNTPKGLRTH